MRPLPPPSRPFPPCVQLFDLLARSHLLKPSTVMLVEYPKQLEHELVETLGPLAKVRSRRYGRTLVAIYAAASAVHDDASFQDDDFGGLLHVV